MLENFNRYLVKSVSWDHIRIIHVTAWSRHLTHGHDVLLAFVARIARASSFTFAVARAFFDSSGEVFVTLNVRGLVVRWAHGAVFEVIVRLFHTMHVELVVLLWLAAAADWIRTSVATIRAIFETWAGWITCWKRWKKDARKVTYWYRKSGRSARSSMSHNSPCKQGRQRSSGRHTPGQGPRRWKNG